MKYYPTQTAKRLAITIAFAVALMVSSDQPRVGRPGRRRRLIHAQVDRHVVLSGNKQLEFWQCLYVYLPQGTADQLLHLGPWVHHHQESNHHHAEGPRLPHYHSKWPIHMCRRSLYVDVLHY